MIGALSGETIHLVVPAQPEVSGTAGVAYNHSDQLASIDLTSALTGDVLQTTLAGVSATGVVSDTNGAAGASSVVDGLQIHLGGLVSLLASGDTEVTSSANIEGSCSCGGGAPQVSITASTTLTNAVLDCFIGTGLALPENPPPDTTILDGLGMRIVLNEQQIENDSLSSVSVTVNAIHLSFNDVLVSGIGSVSGDVIVGRSVADLSCRPQAELVLCAGDCNHDGAVTIDELIMAVRIAIGDAPIALCASCDLNADGAVTVDEVVRAVRSLLDGCGP